MTSMNAQKLAGRDVYVRMVAAVAQTLTLLPMYMYRVLYQIDKFSSTPCIALEYTFNLHG